MQGIPATVWKSILGLLWRASDRNPVSAVSQALRLAMDGALEDIVGEVLAGEGHQMGVVHVPAEINRRVQRVLHQRPSVETGVVAQMWCEHWIRLGIRFHDGASAVDIARACTELGVYRLLHLRDPRVIELVARKLGESIERLHQIHAFPGTTMLENPHHWRSTMVVEPTDHHFAEPPCWRSLLEGCDLSNGDVVWIPMRNPERFTVEEIMRLAF